jgi:hypothetical protein
MVNVPRAFLKWPVPPTMAMMTGWAKAPNRNTPGVQISPWLFGIPVILLVPLTAIKAAFA